MLGIKEIIIHSFQTIIKDFKTILVLLPNRNNFKSMKETYGLINQFLKLLQKFLPSENALYTKKNVKRILYAI